MAAQQSKAAQTTPWQRQRPATPALRLVLGLVVLVVLGTFALILPFEGREHPLSWNEALFTATSALTVTGLSIITPGSDLSIYGQLALLLLIQMGGVGFMVVAVVVLRLLGRRIRLTDRLALSDSLGLLAPAAIVRLTMRVLLIVLLLEGLGALLLFLHWRNDPRLTEGQAAFYAIFHAVSAFCNAGFDLFSGTPGYPDGIPRDNLSLIILGSLIFLGGLGIPVLAELFTFWRIRHFSLHTRITMRVVIFLLLFGAINIALAESRQGATLDAEPLPRLALISLFQSISARTAGFAGIADFTALSPATMLVLIILMFIGCAPASMGGGITTGTFAALTISLWSFARGQQQAQFGGRTLAVGTMRKAAAVLTISLFVVCLAIWLILMTHDAPFDLVTFEVVSAFATCGLTMGMTSELNLFGQMVICFVMFWGRLGALTIIVAIARSSSRPDVLHYPEEQILIG
ncbi:TrkH family potassium uptake protein [Candidatus Viridilinea mediisalina]|uniref:Potassium transporter n=1 Tax=Candidatus Viridilinea mediisalina TaxID=2024553 RepID=A0A2A6RE26_9CHLR|nr:potassium transporter TrkG [Candidatus Viridilinea mediisalina]PDW00376.1 potassium transporter [Candidatus Viridilinea mediisalina]